jgi:hypothetical protein
MQSKQQVVHVVGWAIYKIAMAAFAKLLDGNKTDAHDCLCAAIDEVQLDSAQHAAKSADAEYYRYSLDRQKVDPTAYRKGLRYVRLPVANVFFLVEHICIHHFNPKTITRNSYMAAQRQGGFTR